MKFQHGSILVLTLVLLLFLQVVAATVIHSNHISHHIVCNFELRNTLENIANKVVDHFVKDKDFFLNYKSYLGSNDQFRPSVVAELEGISTIIVEFHCFDNVTYKKSHACDITHQIWQLEVMVSDKNKTVFLSVIQGLKLIIKNHNPASPEEEIKINVKKLWWYRI
jgi:hypothetical protein